MSRHLDSGALHELTLTTNGSQLATHAADLAACGVRRVNVSLDTLDAAAVCALPWRGQLAPVLEGHPRRHRRRHAGQDQYLWR